MSRDPKRFNRPLTTTWSPALSRRSMKRRPNHVAVSVPVSSSRTAIVRWTRRRNVGSTRSSRTPTRAETTSPSGVHVRSPSRRISRRSSYRRGRWNSRSRTVETPIRRPARATIGAAGNPERAIGASRSSAGVVGTGRGFDAGEGFGAATPLLGRDEVAVVRLAAMDDLDLRARRDLVDPAGERLRGREVRPFAVVERDQLVALVQAPDAVDHRV